MNIGEQGPDFELDDDTGTPPAPVGPPGQGPVVLYFYPKAMTRGCTKESCHFRDLGVGIRCPRSAAGRDIRRPGGQAERVLRQAQFDFPLLSDPDKEVAELFGVKRAGRRSSPTSRATFVIGADGTVLKDIITPRPTWTCTPIGPSRRYGSS